MDNFFLDGPGEVSSSAIIMYIQLTEVHKDNSYSFRDEVIHSHS